MRRHNLRDVANRGAFTLIEILIVVAIVGLLAGITLVAVSGARKFAGSAVARQRVDDVAQCVEMYKQKFGEYPPDASATDAEIKAHIIKRWPNALKSGNIAAMVATARAEMDKGPGTALLFWLAGPEVGGAYDGFSSDDRDPFNTDDDEPKETPLIELTFDSDGTGGGNFNVLGLMYKNSPIIYFRANRGGGYDGKVFDFPSNAEGGGSDVAAPYMKNGTWYNADSFQLIYAGDDGYIGAPLEEDDGGIPLPRDLGTKVSVSELDRDNVTNFSQGATLESEIED